MKLQRSTLILVGVAFLLGAGVLITEAQRVRAPETAEQATGEPLLRFAEEDVVALEVQRDGETLVFERDDSGMWQMIRPDQEPAEAGAVAFLLTQLSTATSQPPITITPDQQADFGFLDPAGQIELELADGTTYTVVLGSSVFSGSDRYALVDPAEVPLPEDAGETTVYVVAENLANAINRPLAEWIIAAEEPAPEATDPEAANSAEETAEEEATDSADTDSEEETSDNPEAPPDDEQPATDAPAEE